MSSDKQTLVSVLDSLVSELENYNKTTPDRMRHLDTDRVNASGTLLTNVTLISTIDPVNSTLSDFITNSTNTFIHNLKQNTTETSIFVNSSISEVTIKRPEVTYSDTIGVAEKVVIGAAVVVVVFAVLAILLRICLPLCRSEQQSHDSKLYGLDNNESISGYTHIGAEISSQSSSGSGSSQSQDWSQSTGSNPSTDWSEISSNQPINKSKSQKEEIPEPEMAGNYQDKGVRYMSDSDFRRSTTSLPMYLQEERRISSSKSSPVPQRRIHAEMISVISTQSLEPLRMEQAYRNRWDDQWDPEGSLPRGNLSHHSHPSESRLSLDSYSSHGSSANFPIPSKDIVMKLHLDKSKRYPSTTIVSPTVKKEKHVRLSPPNDR